MGMVYGKVFVWVERILAKILSLLLGWEIECDLGKMGGVRINLFNWLSRGCMVYCHSQGGLCRIFFDKAR